MFAGGGKSLLLDGSSTRLTRCVLGVGNKIIDLPRFAINTSRSASSGVDTKSKIEGPRPILLLSNQRLIPQAKRMGGMTVADVQWWDW